ncbi:hypothetical protein VEx25_1794 [Vibrio antiquarius]|uniref:Uncharacterized protein n=1 Tax=Vibrio antiquarius (strain Ex25) TaxID=150340 RepID=A0ABM9WY99_VIBAE|nr:hypothetical protein VEx25_1794 [Vibrio antiquarius]
MKCCFLERPLLALASGHTKHVPVFWASDYRGSVFISFIQ